MNYTQAVEALKNTADEAGADSILIDLLVDNDRLSSDELTSAIQLIHEYASNNKKAQLYRLILTRQPNKTEQHVASILGLAIDLPFGYSLYNHIADTDWVKSLYVIEEFIDNDSANLMSIVSRDDLPLVIYEKILQESEPRIQGVIMANTAIDPQFLFYQIKETTHPIAVRYFIQRNDLSPDIKQKLALSDNLKVISALIRFSPDVNHDQLKLWAETINDSDTLVYIIDHRLATPEINTIIFDRFKSRAFKGVGYSLAESKNTTPDQLQHLYKRLDYVAMALAQNPSTPASILEDIVQSRPPESEVIEAVYANINYQASEETLNKIKKKKRDSLDRPNVPQVDLDETSIHHKTSTDLELLKRLKGYLNG